jgi:WD40 repeat protein
MRLSCCILSLILSVFRALAQDAPELVLQTGHPSFVDRLAFSSDSRTLMSHGFDGSVRVWDLSHRSIRRTWERDTLVGDRFQTFALSSTGQEILVRNMRSGVDVVSIASGEKISGFDMSIMSDDQRAKSIPFTIVTAVAESPNGQWRVGSDDSGSIIAFSTRSKSARIVQRTGPPATDFWFSPQAKRLVVGRQDGSLLLFNMDTAQRAETPPDFKLKPGTAVAVTEEGDVFLATGEVGKITLINLTKGTVQEIACRCEMEMLSADGKRLAALELEGEYLHRIRIWATNSLSELPSLPTTPVVYRAEINMDGTMVALGGYDGSISVSTKDGIQEQSGKIRIPASLEVRPDGELLVIDTEGGIRLWDMRAATSSMKLHAGILSRTTLSPNAHFVALSGAQGTLMISNPATRQFENTGIPIPEHGLYSLSVSEDGNAVSWKTGSISVNSDEVSKWMTGLLKDSNATSSNEQGQVSKSTVTRPKLADFTVHVATRQEGWKPKDLCSGENPVGVFYRGTLLVANCKVPEQEKDVAPDWDVRCAASHEDLIVFAGNNKVMIRDHTGSVQLRTEALLPTSIGFSPNNRYVAIEAENQIVVVDLQTKTVADSWRPPHPIQPSVFGFSDGSSQIGIDDDGMVALIDGSGVVQLYTQEGRPQLRLLSVGDDQWLVMDETGRFDTSDIEESSTTVKWRSPDEPEQMQPIEIFMRDYFTPELLKYQAAGRLPEVPAVSKLNRIQPTVKILGVRAEPGRPDLVTVDVKVGSVQRTVKRTGIEQLLSSGVFDVHLFRDGQIVGEYPRTAGGGGVGVATSPSELERWRKQSRVLDLGDLVIAIPHVQLPRRNDVTQVVFTAYAFNRDRIKSETSPPFAWKIKSPATPARQRAYLITMAVNANQTGWDLSLSSPSASEVRELWTKRLSAHYEIVPISLDSQFDDQGVILPHPTATKGSLRAVLDILAGRDANVPPPIRKAIDPMHRLRKATPDDAVVLYIASHGYVDPQGHFYAIPFDTGLRPGINEQLLRQCDQSRNGACGDAVDFLGHSISSDDLSLWWRDVDAGDMIMILDSCHSGAIPGYGFRPGPLGDRGFGQLSYDKGMLILAASQPDQIARATSLQRLGHTLLAEALLSAAKEEPAANIENWLKLTEEQLPQRAEELYPGINSDDLQLPELLDFSTTRRKIVAMLSK